MVARVHDQQNQFSRKGEQRTCGILSHFQKNATNTQSTPVKVEPPPEFRALTLLDDAPDAKTRPEWQDPVR